MNSKNFNFLKSLCESAGVSGREHRVLEIIEKSADGLFDSTSTDAMGNFIAKRKATAAKGKGKSAAKGKKIMLACHMDEIGFYVKYIDDKGFIRLNAIGGLDRRTLTAREVLIQGRKDVRGVLYPASKPIHLTPPDQRSKLPEVEEFYIDTFMDAAKVKKLVRVGDPVSMVQDARRIGDAIVAKSLDNRVAVYTGLSAIGQLAKRKSCPNEVYFVATVQEEVGCRGAGPAAAAIQPDVAIAIDVTIAADTPGMPAEDAVSKFGGGAAIKIMDSGSISSRELVDEFVALAEKHKIPHQMEILPRGGTDASAVQRAATGCKAITISVPCRYVHTTCESIHADDLQAAVDLVTEFLAS